MAATPHLVLNEDVVRFVLSLKPQKRSLLMKTLDQLRDDHWRRADFQESDSTGRKLSVATLNAFLITYWVDGAVDELRVIDISLVS